MTTLLEPVIDGLDTTKLRFIDVLGVPTRYYEDGSGETLVLFHGGHFGSLYSLDAWSMALPALAQRFRVIAVDKLGQGYTGNPASPEDYTFEQLVEHSIAFLDALGIRDAHLAGHSRGALLIAAIAFARPDLAKTCVCVSTNTLAPDDPAYPGGQFYKDVEARTPPGPPSLASVRMEPDAQAWSTAQVTDDFVARLLEIAELPSTQEARAAMQVVGETVFMPSLARVKQRTLELIDDWGMPCPTLVIWGWDDRSAFVPLATKLYARIAAKTDDCALHIVNHSGHYVFREQTDEFVRAVSAFCLR
ncbi:MAG: alpha/beta hydrolase [Dehalococcoidia bacterium]|nr:alpha/beta hydrolase [Dehalococcoidia bacterium]